MIASRYAVAALLLASLSSAADDRESQGLEPLDNFPHATLQIESTGATHQFDVWVADQPSRRAQGLMFVEKLEHTQGMLFLYDQPQTISMWMKNTLIPLDMLFVAADGRITRIARRTRPKSLDTISSLGFVTAVIELRGGESKRLGIEPGDRVVHPAFAHGSG